VDGEPLLSALLLITSADDDASGGDLHTHGGREDEASESRGRGRRVARRRNLVGALSVSSLGRETKDPSLCDGFIPKH
jgi:hypothetical protein